MNTVIVIDGSIVVMASFRWLLTLLSVWRLSYYLKLALQANGWRGAKPLNMAVRQGHIDVAKLLLQYGADPDAVEEVRLSLLCPHMCVCTACQPCLLCSFISLL